MTEHLPDNSIQPQFGGSLQPDGSERMVLARRSVHPIVRKQANGFGCWRIGAWMLKQKSMYEMHKTTPADLHQTRRICRHLQ